LHPGNRYLLIFHRKPKHATQIVDLKGRRYISNPQMRRGDCKPAWSPDGSYLLTTARMANRPLLKTPFNAAKGIVGQSRRLIGMHGIRYYLHDARVSNDGKWLVFGGKVLLGARMLGRREIYIWRIGEPQSSMVRLTFNTAEDGKPSLFVARK
jgi:hypothetical protein